MMPWAELGVKGGKTQMVVVNTQSSNQNEKKLLQTLCAHMRWKT